MNLSKILHVKITGVMAVGLIAMIFLPVDVIAQSNGTYLGGNALTGGIGLGSVLAVVASWSRNKSVLWAILHAFLGWIYVIYYVVTR